MFVRVKLTFKVDDETGSTLFRAFDNVMINVAAVNSTSQVVFYPCYNLYFVACDCAECLSTCELHRESVLIHSMMLSKMF